MLPRSLGLLFGFSDNGWVALATFALMAIAYTAFQWKLTLLAAPFLRQVGKFLKLRK
jgi:hypothetical protein